MLNLLPQKHSSIKKKQDAELQKILEKVKRTEFGKTHKLENVAGYVDFKKRVPITDYSDISEFVERMKKGEKDVLWPGIISNFAVSAGTTGDGKHIPLSEERLKSDQRFMRKVFTSYAMQRPNLFPLLGSHISLPGQINQHDEFEGVDLGEISAFLAKDSPGILKMFQVHDPDKMIYQDWNDKFDDVLEKAVAADVRQITAVPSWILSLFQEALKKTGKSRIRELWPNLRLIITGGEALGSYIPHFNKLCDGLDIDYVENYGASEGYLAYADQLDKDDLYLMTDNGLFYEWIPNPPADKNELKNCDSVPTWEVQKDTPYAVLITNNCGLMRYSLNDLVEFTDLKQPRIKVVGRVSDMLDRFGEAVEIGEINEAISYAQQETGAEVGLFTLGAMLEQEHDKPLHVWFVQWVKEPGNTHQFIEKLDASLRKQNRHYANRRKSGTLKQLELHNLTDEILADWKDKVLTSGAQTKIPNVLQEDDHVKGLRNLCTEKTVLKGAVSK